MIVLDSCVTTGIYFVCLGESVFASVWTIKMTAESHLGRRHQPHLALFFEMGVCLCCPGWVKLPSIEFRCTAQLSVASAVCSGRFSWVA